MEYIRSKPTKDGQHISRVYRVHAPLNEYQLKQAPMRNRDNFRNEHLYIRTDFYPEENDTFIPSPESAEMYHDLAEENEQLTLFKHRYLPARSVVNNVGGTERGRTHFPLLLAIANNESLREHGIPLSPPKNLSDHSLKIVQGLNERGLLPKGTTIPPYAMNSITFDDYPHLEARSSDDTPISEQEIREGKNSLRQMLRPRKPLSEQFDNVENYYQPSFEGF